MSYPPKVNAALTRLAETDMSPRTYSPPLHRLLWRVGVSIPPPHFASFGANFSFLALGFGSCWGLIMWFLFWSKNGTSVLAVITFSALAGGAFGAFMALMYNRAARKHKLPTWSEIEPLS